MIIPAPSGSLLDCRLQAAPGVEDGWLEDYREGWDAVRAGTGRGDWPVRPLSRPFLVKRVAALGSGRWWFQGHW